jgi:hypothetical protein
MQLHCLDTAAARFLLARLFLVYREQIDLDRVRHAFHLLLTSWPILHTKVNLLVSIRDGLEDIGWFSYLYWNHHSAHLSSQFTTQQSHCHFTPKSSTLSCLITLPPSIYGPENFHLSAGKHFTICCSFLIPFPLCFSRPHWSSMSSSYKMHAWWN